MPSEIDIEEIREAYKENRLIPFIGAGFSKPLGLPDWSGLVANAAKSVGFEPDLFSLHGNNQQLLEYIKSFHPSVWQEFIHQIKLMFDCKDSDDKRRVSVTHKSLSELDIRVIYTTNYDRHIEKALEEKNKKVLSLATLSDFVKSSEHKPDCEVIKFHGSILDENSMILTETQYFDRLSLDEAVDQRLRSDLLSNNFLFIGYSFNDPNIRYIWYKIHKLKKQQSTYTEPLTLRSSYYVTFGNEPIQAKLLEKWNIKIITLDPQNRSESLSYFLNSIKD